MRGFAVGYISVGKKLYPKPIGTKTTWAIFVSAGKAIEFRDSVDKKIKIAPVNYSIRKEG